VRACTPLAMCVALLAACATTSSPQQHTVVLFTGEVVSRNDIRGTSSGPGVYRPGMGGATGGLVAGLFDAFDTRVKYIVYDVKSVQGITNYFVTEQDFALGSCVDVVTRPETVDPSKRKPGDISFRASSACSK